MYLVSRKKGSKMLKKIGMLFIIIVITMVAKEGTIDFVSPPLTSNNFNKIITFKDEHFLFGNFGTFAKSQDGATWEKQTNFTDVHITSAAHNGSLLIAVGNPNLVFSSSDGENWVSTELGPRYRLGFGHVFYLNERFFILSGYSVHTSVDGESWTDITPPDDIAYGYNSMAYANNKLILSAANNILVSDNGGTTWIESEIKPELLDIVAYNNTFYGVGKQKGTMNSLVYSTDGSSWLNLETDFSQDELRNIYVENSALFLLTKGTNEVYRSTNGTDWERIFRTRYFRDMITIGEALFFVGNDGALFSKLQADYSSNGFANGVWDDFIVIGGMDSTVVAGAISKSYHFNRDTLQEIIDRSVYGIMYNDGELLFASYSDIHTYNPINSWGQYNLPDPGVLSFCNGPIGIVAACDNGDILTLTESNIWELQNTTFNTNNTAIRKIKYSNGVFLGFSSSGNYFYKDPTHLVFSTDGIVWNNVEQELISKVTDISVFNDQFVVSGDSLILYSNDAVNWVAESTPAPLKAITVHNNSLYGINYAGNNTLFSLHKDSTDWKSFKIPSSQKLSVIESINGFIYIAGENGTLIKYSVSQNTAISEQYIGSKQNAITSTVTDGLLSVTLNNTITRQHSGVTIYQANGRVVFSSHPQVSNGLVQVNIDHFSAGVYFIKVTVDDQSYVNNIIID